MAANIFTGTTNSNWGTATNWSLGSVPTASDGHVATFDASSPDCTINASSRVCNAIDFTGYTNTISGDAARTLTVSGNITLGAGMGDGGNIMIQSNANLTLTTNGYAWKGIYYGGVHFTTTLADDFYCTRFLNTWSHILNGNKIYILEYLDLRSTISGTSALEFSGVNVTAHASTNTSSSLNVTGGITVNCSGIFTVSSSLASNRFTINTNTSGVLTFTAGTLNQTCIIEIGYLGTFNCSGYSFGTLYLHPYNATLSNSAELVADKIIVSNASNTEPTFGTTNAITVKEFEIINVGSNICIIKMVNGKVLNVSDKISIYSYVNGIHLSSASGTFNLNLGANCIMNCITAQLTGIDCSGGKTLKTLLSLLTSTTNITNYNTFYFADELPAVADVKTGTTYGDARGTVFTGTLASGGGAMAIMT